MYISLVIANRVKLLCSEKCSDDVIQCVYNLLTAVDQDSYGVDVGMLDYALYISFFSDLILGMYRSQKYKRLW